MDAQTRLAMARMRQSRAEREAAKRKTSMGFGFSEDTLREFSDSMDRITSAAPGTTYKRWLLRKQNPKDGDLDYAGQHHGSAGCNSCGGYGWAPTVVGDVRGLAQCMDCDHWEEQIEAGVAKFVSDKDYRKRCELRQREFFDVGVATIHMRNAVAVAIVKRGREAFGGGKRTSRKTSFGDL